MTDVATRRTGSQVPTYEWVPDAHDWSTGQDTVDFGHGIGLHMDPWQSRIIRGSMGETDQELFQTNEIGVIVSRQNGKGGIIELRELAGLFVLGEDFIIHSAHEFKTSNDAFRRMQQLVEMNPDLDRRVMHVHKSNHNKGFEFKVDGRTKRLQYLTRSRGSGRGFTKANVIILDEAMILDDGPIGAMLPIMATQPRWQVWYTASAGDVRLPTSSVVLARVRRRGYRHDPGLAFFEWAAHLRHTKECADDCTLDARMSIDTWHKVIPALGIRVTEDFIRKMAGAMASWDFDREFLGAGVYPVEEGWGLVPEDTWVSMTDRGSVRGPDAFAVGIEVAHDGSYTSISIMARRADGLIHMEMVERREGTAWVPAYLKALKRKRPCAFVVYPKSKVDQIIPDIEAMGIELLKPSLPTWAAWCARMMQSLTETFDVRHIGQPTMTDAVKHAKKRELGNGTFAFDPADTAEDTAPFLAATLALGGLITKGTKKRRVPMVASA